MVKLGKEKRQTEVRLVPVLTRNMAGSKLFVGNNNLEVGVASEVVVISRIAGFGLHLETKINWLSLVLRKKFTCLKVPCTRTP